MSQAGLSTQRHEPSRPQYPETGARAALVPIYLARPALVPVHTPRPASVPRQLGRPAQYPGWPRAVYSSQAGPSTRPPGTHLVPTLVPTYLPPPCHPGTTCPPPCFRTRRRWSTRVHAAALKRSTRLNTSKWKYYLLGSNLPLCQSNRFGRPPIP